MFTIDQHDTSEMFTSELSEYISTAAIQIEALTAEIYNITLQPGWDDNPDLICTVFALEREIKALEVY